MSDWISVEDRLPNHSGPVQAITDDYPALGVAVVPARYVRGIGWRDIDNIDGDGCEEPLVQVVAWQELAAIPAELNKHGQKK